MKYKTFTLYLRQQQLNNTLNVNYDTRQCSRIKK